MENVAEKQLVINPAKVWEVARRIIFALALGFLCGSAHDSLLPWRGYEPIYISFLSGLIFGLSIRTPLWFMPRLGLALSAGLMAYNLIAAFGSWGGHGPFGMSEGGLVVFFAVLTAFTLPPFAGSART